jgi:hypothetical protein
MGHSLAGGLRGKSIQAVKCQILAMNSDQGLKCREVLTPPFSQIKISSSASVFSDGKNQKYNSRVSFVFFEIGNKPAYDSPISKFTSGIADPLTENSVYP